MKPRQSAKYIALAVGLAVLCGCGNRTVPITNFDNQPWPVAAQRLTFGELTQRVERSASTAGWKLSEIAPGQLQAVLTEHRHIITVRITFNESAYSIDFVSSVNMDQENGKIHRKYVEWVELLEAAMTSGVGGTA